MARRGEEDNSEALVNWLWDTWGPAQRTMRSDLQYEEEGRSERLTHTVDRWLDRHIPSMNHDIQFTLWDNPQYDFKADDTKIEEGSEQALKVALAS